MKFLPLHADRMDLQGVLNPSYWLFKCKLTAYTNRL